jgi:hypothetical protein
MGIGRIGSAHKGVGAACRLLRARHGGVPFGTSSAAVTTLAPMLRPPRAARGLVAGGRHVAEE